MHSLTEPVVSSAGEQAATISTTAPNKPHLHMAHLRPGLLPARSHQVCTKTILHQGRRNVAFVGIVEVPREAKNRYSTRSTRCGPRPSSRPSHDFARDVTMARRAHRQPAPCPEA